MSDAGEIVFRVAGICLLVAGMLTQIWTRRARHRWGHVNGPVMKIGDGAYRRSVMRERVPRNVPLRIKFAASFGAGWGLLTCGVFTPGGLFFMLAPAHIEPGSQVLLTLSGLGVFATSLGGVALGWSLVRTSRALVLRAPNIVDRAMPTVLWSAIHHCLVIVSFVLFAVHERDSEIAIAVGLVCSIGLLQAWVTARAACFASRFRDVDDATISR